MSQEFTQPNDTTREYNTTISREELNERIGSTTTEVASGAQLNGFRRGKAPREIIKQRYGNRIMFDVLQEIMAEQYRSLFASLEEEGVRVAWESQPKLYFSDEASGEPIYWSIRLETVPEFTLPNLSEIHVKKQVTEITDESVEERIRAARNSCVELFELRDGDIQAQEGDLVSVSWTDDSAENTETTDGDSSGQVIEVIDLTELDDAPSGSEKSKLLGCRIGEKRTIDVSILAPYASKPLQADEESSAEVEVTVTKIEVPCTPVMSPMLTNTSAFQQAIGSSTAITENGLASFLHSELQYHADRHAENRFLQQIMLECVRSSDLVLPRECLRRDFETERLRGTGADATPLTEHIRTVVFDEVLDDQPITVFDIDDESVSPSNDRAEDVRTTRVSSNESKAEETAERQESEDSSAAQSDMQTEDFRSEEELQSDEAQDAAVAAIYESIQKTGAETGLANVISAQISNIVVATVIKEKSLTVDSKWIEERLGNLTRARYGNETPPDEFLDELYSDRTYANLANENYLAQVTEFLVNEVSSEEEQLSEEDFLAVTGKFNFSGPSYFDLAELKEIVSIDTKLVDESADDTDEVAEETVGGDTTSTGTDTEPAEGDQNDLHSSSATDPIAEDTQYEESEEFRQNSSEESGSAVSDAEDGEAKKEKSGIFNRLFKRD